MNASCSSTARVWERRRGQRKDARTVYGSAPPDRVTSALVEIWACALRSAPSERKRASDAERARGRRSEAREPRARDRELRATSMYSAVDGDRQWWRCGRGHPRTIRTAQSVLVWLACHGRARQAPARQRTARVPCRALRSALGLDPACCLLPAVLLCATFQLQQPGARMR